MKIFRVFDDVKKLWKMSGNRDNFTQLGCRRMEHLFLQVFDKMDFTKTLNLKKLKSEALAKDDVITRACGR